MKDAIQRHVKSYRRAADLLATLLATLEAADKEIDAMVKASPLCAKRDHLRNAVQLAETNLKRTHGTLKDLAVEHFEATGTKVAAPGVFAQVRKTVTIPNESAAMEYAEAHAPNLVKTAWTHLGKAKTWLVAQAELDERAAALTVITEKTSGVVQPKKFKVE